MDIAQLQAYGYFALTLFLVAALYGYIYHLYSKKKDAEGIDYERYGDMALKDNIEDTPVSSKSDKEEGTPQGLKENRRDI